MECVNSYYPDLIDMASNSVLASVLVSVLGPVLSLACCVTIMHKADAL